MKIGIGKGCRQIRIGIVPPPLTKEYVQVKLCLVRALVNLWQRGCNEAQRLELKFMAVDKVYKCPSPYGGTIEPYVVDMVKPTDEVFRGYRKGVTDIHSPQRWSDIN